MKVKLILKGYEEVELEGNPREVLQEADELIVRWKVVWDGKEKG